LRSSSVVKVSVQSRLSRGADRHHGREPPERELAERFGASHPTASQALRSLSLMGLVEIRHGAGACVVRRPEIMVAASVSLMLDLDEPSVDHLMRLRLWLEEIGVRGGSGACPRSDRGRGDSECPGQAADAAGHTSELIAADTVFHAALVRGAGNPYLAAMYKSAHSAVLSYQLRSWVDAVADPPWPRDSGLEHWALHEPIAAAVIAGDERAALAAVLAHHQVMAEHLAQVRPQS
jgi:GntR family transcriptional regulator, transcriptional repressor for pyruvate dehydrogenase complex